MKPEILLRNVFFVAGEGTIDLNDPDNVNIAIVFDVSSYGPHRAAIRVDQNPYISSDELFVEAYADLEAYALEKDADYYNELVSEYGSAAGEVFTETFEGQSYTLPAEKAAELFYLYNSQNNVLDFIDIEEE